MGGKAIESVVQVATTNKIIPVAGDQTDAQKDGMLGNLLSKQNLDLILQTSKEYLNKGSDINKDKDNNQKITEE